MWSTRVCSQLGGRRTDRQTDRQTDAVVSPLPTPAPDAQSSLAKIAIDAIARSYNLAQSELRVLDEETVQFPTLGRTYQYVVVNHPGKDGIQPLAVMVDSTTGTVEMDAQALFEAERAAHIAKYGKLHPDLYIRLQKAASDERLPVAIWLLSANEEQQSDPEVPALTQLYPEAGKAAQERGAPWLVDDPALSETIRKAYSEQLQQEVSRNVDPFVAWLGQQGFSADTIPGTPSVTLALTKAEIEKVVTHPQIAEIYLLEDDSAPAMDIATQTDRLSRAWRQGLDGSGIRIAIVEGGGNGSGFNINAAADSCVNIGATMNPALPEGDHISRVAAIAGCNNALPNLPTNTPPGVAGDATVLDGGFAGGTNPGAVFADALSWAILTGQADVVNISWSNWPINNPTSTALQYADRVADYWTRISSTTLVVAAGNTPADHRTTVSSPGKGYNVLTVGNISDGNTSSWSDDEINFGGSHVNPGTGVEKPEVAAPGTNINTIAGASTGTSFATPQVSGLAALMMEQNGDLRGWPSAVKAIIMASAVHNVEGDRTLSTRDGAGSINAAMAVHTADNRATGNECFNTCWWGLLNNAAPAPNGFIDRFIYATKGERIRIVTSWFSVATYTHDALAINYDLKVYRPSDNPPTRSTPWRSSASATSNTEILEFVAPETGQYRIEIARIGNDPDISNALAIAWTRQATFLPDVRGSNSGWTSSIIIRNDGAEDRDVSVTYLNGTTTPTTLQMQPGTVATVQPPASYSGAAVVDGSEDLSVVVYTDGTARGSLDNGFLPQGAGDASFEQANPILYAPAFYKNSWGINSSVSIVNVGTEPTTVNVEFIGRPGNPNYPDYGHTTPSIPPGGRVTVNGSQIQNNGATWVGSLRLTSSASTRPIVATVYDDTTTNPVYSRSYNATVVASGLVYVPAAYRNQWGFNTGLVVQNQSGGAIQVDLTFCPRLVQVPGDCPFTTINLEPWKAQGVLLSNLSFLSNGWTGSVKLQSRNGVPIAVVVTNSYDNVGGYNFSATGRGGRTVFLPYAAKNANGISTGYTVRNTSGITITVQALYYNQDGTRRTSADETFTLLPAQVRGNAQILNGGLPNPPESWQGSIVLQSTGDIVAMMRADDGDAVSAYNGIVR